MKNIKLIFCIAMALSLFGCDKKAETAISYTNERGCKVETSSMNYFEKYQDTYAQATYFDTSLTLAVYAEKAGVFVAAFDEMIAQFKYYHELFDKYNNYEGVNNVKTINDMAGIEPVKVDAPLIELMLLSKEWYEKSHGAFDITLGPVLTIWHDYREAGIALNSKGLDGELPKKEDLEAANEFVGWKYVEIDEANSTVFINHPKASIDVGGVAKGFATEKVALALECSGTVSGFVNAGGNVRTIGDKPDGTPWITGIANPNKSTGESIISLKINSVGSLVTSGDYQRYYTIGDKKYSHLISPFTLYPPELYHSTSVQIANSGIADILSTTMYMLPYEEGLEILNSVSAHGVWLSDNAEVLSGANVENYNDVYIGSDGKISTSSHLVTWDK